MKFPSKIGGFVSQKHIWGPSSPLKFGLARDKPLLSRHYPRKGGFPIAKELHQLYTIHNTVSSKIIVCRYTQVLPPVAGRVPSRAGDLGSLTLGAGRLGSLPAFAWSPLPVRQ